MIAPELPWRASAESAKVPKDGVTALLSARRRVWVTEWRATRNGRTGRDSPADLWGWCVIASLRGAASEERGLCLDKQLSIFLSLAQPL